MHLVPAVQPEPTNHELDALLLRARTAEMQRALSVGAWCAVDGCTACEDVAQA